MSQELKEKISEFDQLIRSGRGHRVRVELASIPNPPRELLADFALLSIRADYPALALKFLQAIVYPKRLLATPASPRELAIYSWALAAIGALSEAERQLLPIASDPTPEVQLYLGFLAIYRWDYASAIPFFEKYLTLPTPSAYQKIVARVNLAASLNFCERYRELEGLLKENVALALENGWNLLAIESLLTSVQSNLACNDLENARTSIESAFQLSRESGFDEFYIKKWDIIRRLHQEGGTNALLSELRSFRQQAQARSAWEAVRDSEFYEGLFSHNTALMKRTYFGTPFASYRERLLQKTKGWFRPGDTYLRKMDSGEGPTIDFTESSLGGKSIRGGNTVLPVLRTVGSDFFRPCRVGDLHASLYPGERFNPESSPARVRTALSRTRKRLAEANLPLLIDCSGTEYSLIATGPCRIRVALNYDAKSEIPPQFLSGLRSRWPYQVFTSRQAAETLKLDVDEARRLLQSAVAESKIIRIGSGRSTLYRIAG